MMIPFRTMENTEMKNELDQADKDLLHYVMDAVHAAMMVAFNLPVAQMTPDEQAAVLNEAERLASIGITARVMTLRPVSSAPQRQPIGFSVN